MTTVDDQETGWEPPEDFDATEAIMRNLVASSKGKPTNEDEVEYASCLLACQALVSRGVSIDTAMRCVEQAATNGQIRIRYSDAEGLEVTIERDDEPDAMTWKPDRARP